MLYSRGKTNFVIIFANLSSIKLEMEATISKLSRVVWGIYLIYTVFENKTFCFAQKVCPENEFICSSGECINSLYKCDKKWDCLDGSDERSCCTSQNGLFPCKSGQCISLNNVCDRINHCSDGSDEENFCKQKDCNSKKCSHYCKQTGSGANCYCHSGYVLDYDGVNCVDVDECQLSPLQRPCLHECINTLGGYQCACFLDYHLIGNVKCIYDSKVRHVCRPFLDSFIIATFNGIITTRYLDCLDNNPLQFSTNTNPDVLTYNWRGSVVYAFDAKSKQIMSINLKNKIVKPFITFRKLLFPILGLKYDSFSGNIYWLIHNKGVQVASSSGKIVTIISGLENGHDLALNPIRDEMYISVWGLDGSIMVADLSGSNLRKIDEVGSVGRVIGLTVQNRDSMIRLFWINALAGTLDCLDISGPKGIFGIKSTIRRDMQPVRSIMMHRDILYMMNYDDKIYKVAVYQYPQMAEPVDWRLPESVSNLRIIYAPNDNHTGPCLVNNYGCNHVCLMVNQRPTCRCSDKYLLDKDGKTCKKQLCKLKEFLCQDGGKCISLDRKCDGIKDCDDGSDEFGCRNQMCEIGYKRCSNITREVACIPEKWFCDGYKDCESGYDELNCKSSCKLGEFDCGNSCISAKFVCDTLFDCSDGRDELKCPK